jgi:hypothetical protein
VVGKGEKYFGIFFPKGTLRSQIQNFQLHLAHRTPFGRKIGNFVAIFGDVLQEKSQKLQKPRIRLGQLSTIFGEIGKNRIRGLPPPNLPNSFQPSLVLRLWW